jgi:hypothetical protein
MNKQEKVTILVVLLFLFLLYLVVNDSNSATYVPHMLWGRFQLMHDFQVNRLLAGQPEKPKTVYYMYKWIIANK